MRCIVRIPVYALKSLEVEVKSLESVEIGGRLKAILVVIEGNFDCNQHCL